jgi:hypothetical protein
MYSGNRFFRCEVEIAVELLFSRKKSLETMDLYYGFCGTDATV